ncbi:hypothetical protein TNCV_1834231 [Trichonephila clavipes]|nr:hypothetical protein TNCV_1834231 [Trichonephila clavipes]
MDSNCCIIHLCELKIFAIVDLYPPHSPNLSANARKDYYTHIHLTRNSSLKDILVKLEPKFRTKTEHRQSGNYDVNFCGARFTESLLISNARGTKHEGVEVEPSNFQPWSTEEDSI